MNNQLKGLSYLRKKLNVKRTRVLTRYKYYEMKNSVPDFGISSPPNLVNVKSVLGWCEKAVDNLADRLVFREFREDNFGMNEIFSMNNPDVFFDSAVLSALISSCCFVYISQDKDGKPRLQVIDGGNATGIINPITGLLTEGYAVLERDPETEIPTLEAYFLPHETQIIPLRENAYSVRHNVEYPLLVPILYKPDAKRPFGRSRITRACMSYMLSAARTIKRTEISAEFFSYPQKWVTGLSPDVEISDKWKASMSAMLTISKDEDGEKPQFGQFMQQSMSPHVEQLKSLASLFAGETGLTLDDLGFPTANPTSAESNKAAHESLRLTARKAQRGFGSGFLNVGFLSVCLRDDFNYKREQINLTKPVWEPIWEPDASMLSSIGDGVIKINQAVPGYIGEENMHDLTGIGKR